uniref:CSRNP_N domain-containing protein n=1 Tax=Mesocestoides corti TaxID=53468 RepID=A0A5K3EMR8_MESCO
MTSLSLSPTSSMNSGHGNTANLLRDSINQIGDDAGGGNCKLCDTTNSIKDTKTLDKALLPQKAPVISLTSSTTLRQILSDEFSPPSPKTPSILSRRNSLSRAKKKANHVAFGLVDLYHFDRLQGFTCVPSQGGSTLGMASEHWVKEHVPVAVHQSRRRYQRHSALLRFCLEGKLLLSLQQFRLLETRVKYQQQLLMRTQESADCSSTNSSGNSYSAESSAECLKRPLEQIENPSDEDLSFLDGLEEYYFLQPLPVKRRRILLRKAGLQKIDPAEKHECAAIRKSRSECGCTCLAGVCDPDTCECALNGIPCQVDRASFPCVCLSPGHCSNPEGRIEFNPVRVRSHYLHTRLRLESEEQRAALEEDEEAASACAKRPRMAETPEHLDGANTSNASLEKHREMANVFGAGQNASSMSSPTTSASVSSRIVEEALQATTPNGGCRDCQNDRYVHFLMQELQCQQFQGNPGHGDGEEEMGGFEQVMLSDNLALDATVYSHRADEDNSCGEAGFSAAHSQSSVDETPSSFTVSTAHCGEEDEDDEEDEDVPDECISSEPYTTVNPSSVKSAISEVSDEDPGKKPWGRSSFCRLEPIASLFHNPLEATVTIPGVEQEEEEEEEKPPAVPSRPPSVCEVVTA